MTNLNPLVALILLTSLLISCVLASEPIRPRNEADPKTGKYSVDPLELLAQDAITITIAEINYARGFMDSIPKLKSLSNLKSDEVLQCVGGLSIAMNNVVGEVQKLEAAFQMPPLYMGTGPLMNDVNVILNYNVICDRALVGVDATIKLMVMRKIEEVVMLSNDVIIRFANISMGGTKFKRKTLKN